MNIDDRSEYVKYRIKSAFNSFDAAKLLADNGFWNSSVNRLYYSVFYAVNALLVHNEIYSVTKKTPLFSKQDFFQAEFNAIFWDTE